MDRIVTCSVANGTSYHELTQSSRGSAQSTADDATNTNVDEVEWMNSSNDGHHDDDIDCCIIDEKTPSSATTDGPVGGSLTALSAADTPDESEVVVLLSKTVHPRTAAVNSAEDPSLRCDVCGFRSTSHTELEVHFKVAHIDQAGPYSCTVCDYTSNYKYHVTRHSKMHLASEHRPYQCQICGRGFVRRKGLTIHQRSHTGERPFVCPYCSRPFTDKSNLTRHIRSNHEQGESTNITVHCITQNLHSSDNTTYSSARPVLECSYCGRPFNDKSNLSRHIRTLHGSMLPG